MKISILVAAHKKYDVPGEEPYLPVHVGAAVSSVSLPYQRDDEGDNISFKNPTYCELTGIYWAYKNLSADYIGLNHYRRYFGTKKHRLNYADFEKLLNKADLILPKKRHYYIETVASQYEHAHGDDLKVVEEAIKESFPDYLDAFHAVMKRRSIHLFNMFVMKKDIFDAYCSFLFPLLEACEEQLKDKPRVYGFLSERMMDVFVEKNALSYLEINVYNTEPQHWGKKIISFLGRKFSRG